MNNISNYSDILAIPFFYYLTFYFYKKKNKKNNEKLLFLFALIGSLADTYFTFLFVRK